MLLSCFLIVIDNCQNFTFLSGIKTLILYIYKYIEYIYISIEVIHFIKNKLIRQER